MNHEGPVKTYLRRTIPGFCAVVVLAKLNPLSCEHPVYPAAPAIVSRSKEFDTRTLKTAGVRHPKPSQRAKDAPPARLR